MSNYVIPSDFWLPEGPGKVAYIAGHKARLSKIPCKHFQNSPADARFCPFGKDCVGSLYTP